MEHSTRQQTKDTLSRRTVQTALACLEPPIRARPEYRRHGVWERLSVPDRYVSFPVLWMDDRGRVRADRGFLAAYGGTLTEGRLILRTGLTGDAVRALAFLGLLEERLRGGSGGVLVWGADRDPAPLSDGESMRLCRGLLNGLADAVSKALPLAGAPFREREYLSGAMGIPAERPLLSAGQAGGLGLCCFAEAALRRTGQQGLYGRTAAVYGEGPLPDAAARMARRLGARVLRPRGELLPSDPAAVYFFCDPGDPLDARTARALRDLRPAGVLEGRPLACTPEAARCLDQGGLLFAPAFAAGSGARRIGPAASLWEAERALRNDMDALCRELLGREETSLFRSACALALQNGAELLLRRGVV